MRAAARKRKGKKFEEKIACVLHQFLLDNNTEYNSLFYNYGDQNTKPKRDSSSGVAITSDGDINLGLAKQFFPFSIECKNNNILTHISFDQLCKWKVSFLEKTYIRQARPAAKEAGLMPLVVFRGTRTLDYCMWNIEDCDVELYMDDPCFRFGNWRIGKFIDFIYLINTEFDSKNYFKNK